MLRTNVATARSSSCRGVGQAVDCGIRRVESKGVLGLSHVGAEKGVEQAGVQFDALRGHPLEEGFRDVDRHLVETLVRIPNRKVLVLVIVVFAKFRLTDGARGRIPEDLRQEPNLERPVVRDAHAADEIDVQRDLAGERVSEGVHVHEIRMRAEDAAQGPQQGGDVQAHGAPVETVRETRIIPLAEIKAEARVRDRVTEPGQKLPVVSPDVAVMDRHHARLVAGEDVPETDPHVPTLARRSGRQFRLFEFLEVALHSRPVVPKEPSRAGQLGEGPARPLPLPRARRAVHPDHDLADILDLCELADDAAEGGRAHLTNMAGKHEGDG